jgi:hypothetical protein
MLSLCKSAIGLLFLIVVYTLFSECASNSLTVDVNNTKSNEPSSLNRTISSANEANSNKTKTLTASLGDIGSSSNNNNAYNYVDEEDESGGEDEDELVLKSKTRKLDDEGTVVDEAACKLSLESNDDESVLRGRDSVSSSFAYAGNAFNYDITCSLNDPRMESGDKYYVIDLIVYGPNTRVTKAWREQYSADSVRKMRSIRLSKSLSFRAVGLNSIVCSITKYNNQINKFARLCQKNAKLNITERQPQQQQLQIHQQQHPQPFKNTVSNTNEHSPNMLIKQLITNVNKDKFEQAVVSLKRSYVTSIDQDALLSATSQTSTFHYSLSNSRISSPNGLLKQRQIWSLPPLPLDFIGTAFRQLSDKRNTTALNESKDSNAIKAPIIKSLVRLSNSVKAGNPELRVDQGEVKPATVQSNAKAAAVELNRADDWSNKEVAAKSVSHLDSKYTPASRSTSPSASFLQPFTVICLFLVIFLASIGTIVYLTYHQKKETYHAVKLNADDMQIATKASNNRKINNSDCECSEETSEINSSLVAANRASYKNSNSAKSNHSEAETSAMIEATSDPNKEEHDLRECTEQDSLKREASGK